MSDTSALMMRIEPRPLLAGLVSRISGYEERGTGLRGSREIAALIVPLVISFADDFRIAFDGEPTAADAQPSFAAGLHPGYVSIDSNGRAACIQIDFTPLGARRFFGIPMSELASRMVAMDDLGDRLLAELTDRLGELRTWPERLLLATDFVERRLERAAPDRESAHAYGAILRTHGAIRIGEIAGALGWSRKRLSAHFRDTVGMTPKTFARVVRFNRAAAVASASEDPDWAGLAVECGYSDQAHLTRDFVEFAGTAPARWRASLL